MSPILKEGNKPCFIDMIKYGWLLIEVIPPVLILSAKLHCQNGRYSNHSLFYNEFYIMR